MCVSANDRALWLLEAVVTAAQPPGLSDLVSTSGLTKPTVRRLLLSLSELGFLRQNELRQYVPGAKILDLAASALAHTDFGAEFTDVLAGMRVRVPATLTMSVFADGRLQTVTTLASNRGYRVAGLGVSAVGLHATASGKAILTFLPQADIEAIFRAEPMRAYTPTTTTNVIDLRSELQEVAKRGYAINDEESQHGVRCIAAAVRDYLAHPVAVVSMSVASSQVSVAVLRRESTELIRAADTITSAVGGPLLGQLRTPEVNRTGSATR